MTHLIHQLGLPSTLAYHDVYSLTDSTLLSFLPRPAYALLLVFPVTPTYETFRQTEDGPLPTYAGSGAGPAEPVVWFKQTIRNACGLIGLLHSVCNGPARALIAPDSALDRLLAEAVPLGPDERAELLYRSHALESAHAEAARKGDSAAPDAEASVDLHFVAFVKVEEDQEDQEDKDGGSGGGRGALWELDGRRKGPLKRGMLGAGEDVLSDKGLELGVRAFLRREEEAGGGELRFSVVMLGPSFE